MVNRDVENEGVDQDCVADSDEDSAPVPVALGEVSGVDRVSVAVRLAEPVGGTVAQGSVVDGLPDGAQPEAGSQDWEGEGSSCVDPSGEESSALPDAEGFAAESTTLNCSDCARMPSFWGTFDTKFIW